MENMTWFHDQLLVFPMDLDEQTAEAALTRLGGMLAKAGFVKETYTQAIVEREKIYPTALPTTIGVAVPHTDSKHVNKLSMAVGVLSKPVLFKEMGSNGEKDVNVRVIMALAIPDPTQVVSMLQHLFRVIQEPSFLPGLVSAPDRKAAVAILNKAINEQWSHEAAPSSAEKTNGAAKEILVKVTHPVGLHARPASVFVKTAKSFQSEIKVCMGNKEANAKSIMNVLQLGAGQGAEIRISACGPDEAQALTSLKELVESNFGGVE